MPIIPSLLRQAVLNMAHGLYEVLPGKIYQVRGFELANISFIKGDTGWIIVDPPVALRAPNGHSEPIRGDKSCQDSH